MTNNGLYNMLFGENKYASHLLDMIKLDRNSFGRYRDCYLDRTGNKIIVLTRCGGGNREGYEYMYKNIRKHKNYLRDFDDNVDNTYSYIEFGVPSIYISETHEMATGIEPLTVGEKFDREIKEMNVPGSDAEQRAQKIATYINNQIDAKPNGGVIWMGDIR